MAANESTNISADAYFAMIPEALLYDERLTSTDVRVYGCLRRFADKASGRCHPSHSTIAEKIHTSDRTVRRSIDALVDAGWVISRRRKSEEGAWTSNSYRVVSVQSDRTPVSYASDTSDRGDRTPVADKPESLNQRNTLTLLSEEREQPDTTPAAQIEADFDEWWSGVWAKKSVGAARKAYKGARKKASREELLLGRDAYARLMKAQGTEPRYWKMPSTWLNQECWEDEDADEPNPFEAPPMRFG